ncbi:serine hydrolase domain-containing protein [Zeaxanthinibacter enoshimensis]|uniref:CubicO group peptidase (Beta-lactamase class C family) n=1 Tax=Zeaxanthinibacter enoshimensis TaxID=392009 RepID=A0A4R6TTC2_9FLAO|nr:serine hydrolase domain-containing protein [Zeaxanthinibacter enoshimensis]TDQ32188.1 CubicO group peptidase (beta-lactamase class C family) [Zeaxanthinibacter enoshimensis]
MRYLFFCFLLPLLAITGCQPSEKKTIEPSQETTHLSGSIDKYFQRIPGFSGNVLIAQSGKVLFSKSYGYADKEFKILNDGETKFKIGSITKPFTAMAVLKLVEDGRLSLSDSAGQYMPGLPPHWQPLTIHQLLSHTSGLTHTWDLLEDSTLMFQKSDLKNTLSWFFKEPLEFEPGTSFSYSGVGYLLLAGIIESLTNTTFDQFLEEIIFEPLDMKDTGAADPEVIIQKLARGYIIDSTGVRNAPHFYVPLLTGGGHLYSTAQDLLKWDRALSRFSILSREMTKQMYTPVKENYGYGWDIVKNDTLNMVFHTGFIPGYLSRIDRYPDYNLTLIILTNYHAEWSPVDSWEITNLIFEELELSKK